MKVFKVRRLILFKRVLKILSADKSIIQKGSQAETFCTPLTLRTYRIDLVKNKKNLRKIRSQMPNKEVSARG